MRREHIAFPCGEISLEGVLHLPDGEGTFPGVVVCHPHPLYGGDMENNVVITICQAMVARSVAALRFNFRGAGGSGGQFGGGVKERDDVTAALDYLFLQKRNRRRTDGGGRIFFWRGGSFPGGSTGQSREETGTGIAGAE